MDAATFFTNTKAPIHLDDEMKKLNSFIQSHLKEGRKVALVTSGGTAVPLEKNTVRFVDNFSGGGRGSASAEYFIEHGYAVIFLFRKTSLQPFVRHFTKHGANMFDILLYNENSNTIEVIPELKETLTLAVKNYTKAMKENRLLKIPFFSVHEYLYLFKAVSQSLNVLKKNALIFAAAAVSDFFLPPNQMAEHKIQSSGGGLDLHLEQVPKMLALVTGEWCPEAYMISFKLETDSTILVAKVKRSMQSGQHLVIGNLLNSYKDSVTLFLKGKEETKTLTRTEEEKKFDSDLEKSLISEIVTLHTSYAH